MTTPTLLAQGEAGKPACQTQRETWSCSNMLPREGDTDMEYEHYECKVCGRTMKLDYEEMR